MSTVSVAKEIFRAYDIRGVVPDTLNTTVAHAVGRALAVMAKGRDIRCIAVGRDGRDSSPDLAAALIAGLNSQDIATVDLGMLPTPVAYWAAATRVAGSCAVVTGSHNPRQYNGIKMTLAGAPIAGTEIDELYQLIQTDHDHTTNSAAAYSEAVLAGRQLKRQVKIVVDCGNGVAGPFYPEILSKLGCDVVSLFQEVDGKFPNHHPDPADPANFTAATQALEQTGAELALAFDGDGDRLGVWLPGSGMFFPDRILMLLARDLLTRQPGATIVYDVKCSVNLAPFIIACGGQPHLCRTGHSFVKRELTQIGAPLGGELSGHFFFNEGDWRFDDALLAAVVLLELVAAAPSASELCASVPDSFATPEYKVNMPAGQSPHDFVRALTQSSTFPGNPKLVLVDGIRAEWPDGFGLVRASNTTPSLILRFEGLTAKARDRIKTDFRTIITTAGPDLTLSF